MLFRSKIKWIALFVLVLSLASLLLHLSIAKSSSVSLVYNTQMASLLNSSIIGGQGYRSKKLWGAVKPLASLQPYTNSRSSYRAPSEQSNGFIYAKIFGGFANIRSSICDLVAISRLLNATLVLPEIQESSRAKGISGRFKSFSYLYDEEQFISYLKNDVFVVKSLPDNLKASRKRNEFPIFKPKSSAIPSYYLQKVLPSLKNAKVIGLILNDGGCLQSVLPSGMSELQRLRCRVGFHALNFRPEVQMLGKKIVQRLRAWGQPFLAFHPGLVRDTLAYHGCAELFQDVHTELIQYRRAQMIKKGIIREELSVDSRKRRDNGTCPLMPEEVGVLLRAMGYPTKTIIYVAGSELFGGQRMLIPLRAMFNNVVDRTSFCNKEELDSLFGPETTLPLDLYRPPPSKSKQQLKDEWNKAGPRPRPLPPPPDRPIYRHEKEGWYGWITETDKEPDPSPMDMRLQAHRLLLDALDYMVCLEADAFFPGFNNDGSSWPDFSSLVMGQRLYESSSSRTYRPDRKHLANLLNSSRENLYHPMHNWTLLVQEHLNKSLGEEGLVKQAIFSKPTSFLSHPLPECFCRISSVETPDHLVKENGKTVYGDEEKCPDWMSEGRKIESLDLAEEGDNKGDEDMESSEQAESYYNSGKSYLDNLIDQDEEMDPND
ncbi:protein EMBRYO SAC DEVELOPMENT ARREST 30 [Cucurbita moschata]|uniref:O-fucosyltransferase family protein n=1 Tax=Cucurbita moschata TaxID=3662 RepID=A0A6J1ER86_CUCMO|nr:protein EMBRYO SAC DEVELOPMENT ARREST 30 [Cucurbita moschata]XP_022930556.1 protein EMBRYO SAC DEVELOPMENT ARREST 30 [Cucurbita moschata]XP_022930557.1 protein EMBRYO SAC DEVELOPMENT ARREST 30 [Cucurbita moschata]XP_022930558.1 protein EMBRYO SAC DEVELOPMENT ARREST 30 [Cucurbita moschata]XP_022930559.1 protein EMBRYO SAC DEVELOPMENT ARREST 30 [Cucurbita moschata]XP_022930560.1 protein EMBRYO SAC DEVELOPMENT ARREST 30 [Cucurbita moschata]XP_022930562.1 protein EMBRYO SAC DEVELOPMENT ARREST 